MVNNERNLFMLNILPKEIVKLICDNLSAKEERYLSSFFPNIRQVFREDLDRRLATVHKNITQKGVFSVLLNLICDDEKTGYAILLNENCKQILINQRSKNLPHWIISLPESQPFLFQAIMNDKSYRDSLSASDTQYLINNHDNLLARNVINLMQAEMNDKPLNALDGDDFTGEEDFGALQFHPN